MGTNFKIWILLAITVIAIFGAIWQIANARGIRSRGRRRKPLQDPKQQRRGDVRSLTAQEKRLYAESQRLIAQGKIAPAARVLEQLNMPREAIQVLEDNGMIHDAAKILMRMQRHNRAGVVYARHGMWEQAAQCFKLANMPLEVAKCAREAAQYEMAAEHFAQVGRFEDAGECMELKGDFQRAARYFAHVGQQQRAMQMYSRLAAAAEDLRAVDFEETELQEIVAYMADGHTDKGLTDLVVSRNKLAEVIGNLIDAGLSKPASELYLRATSDLGPALMARVNYQTKSAACLAEVFCNVSSHHYAGIVYERMTQFREAGEAFEMAEDFERAAYCFERAGLDQKARLLKEKAKLSPFKPRAGQVGEGDFALASVGTSDDSDGQIAEIKGNEEKTALLPMPAAGALSASAAELKIIANVADPAPALKSPSQDQRPAATDDAKASAAKIAPTPLEVPGSQAPHSEVPRSPEAEGSNQVTPGAEKNLSQAGPSGALGHLQSKEHEIRSSGAADERKPNSEQHAPKTPAAPAGIPQTAAVGSFSLRIVEADESAAQPQATTSPSTTQGLQPAVSSPKASLLGSEAASPDSAQGVAQVRLDDGRAAFHKASFFADLDFEQKNKLWDIGATLSFDAEETILTYNDEPQGVYVIIHGSVSCYKQASGKESYIDQMGEAESFGELWLLADQPTAVRFVATKDTKIRVIDREAFNDLLDKDGTVARKVYKRFTMRLLKRLLKTQNHMRNQAAS